MFARIANTPRDYAWGSKTAIAELLGTVPSGRPEAELWLGTHPGSPTRLVDGSGALADLAEGGLPFLLKVLAAQAPLSLQAHPNSEQARAGFARENAAGIPLDAPERTYRDPFHKPELIYALSEPFRALSGFRPTAQVRAALAELVDDPRIAAFEARLVDDAALPDVVAWLITRGEGVDDLIAALVEASAVHDDDSWDAVRMLSATWPGDPGIAVSLLLHVVTLHAGEALYLRAGNIHAYLSGVGVELMSSSDNVLRGAFTLKHLDVPELLRVLEFRPGPAPYLAPIELEPGVLEFRPDVPDFRLTVLEDAALRRGVRFTVPVAGPAILLCTGGSVTVSLSDGAQVLARGESAYVSGEQTLGFAGSGRLFVATTEIRFADPIPPAPLPPVPLPPVE